jgi:hypothetical protein
MVNVLLSKVPDLRHALFVDESPGMSTPHDDPVMLMPARTG